MARSRIPESHGGFPPGALPPFSSSLTALADLRPLGQIHESFIVAVGRDGSELSRIGPHDSMDSYTWAKVSGQQE